MPPKKRLTGAEAALLEDWIARGAPWPGADETTRTASHVTEEDRQFWSFRPVRRPAVPEVANSPWPANEIDRFILARLREHDLAPAPVADRRTLIRRLYQDLPGLPPSPAAVDRFLADPSPGATARLVDRLLASPHYGERWGRHWLDVARYADTQGDVADYPVPWAWKYRNWVYRAFNEDLPIDEFLRWQIAGDLLARKEPDPQRSRDQHIATGFIALSRRFGQFSEGKDHLVIENTIDALGRGMLGLTLRCARCHNHKFDPIPAADYYALYGIFQSTRYPTAGNATDRMPRRLVAVSPEPDAQARLDDYWSEVQRQHRVAGRAGAPRSKPLFEKHEKLHAAASADSATEEDRKRLQEFLEENELLREAFRHGPKLPRQEWARLLQNPPDVEIVFGVIDQPEPRDARLHRYGEPGNLGPPVPRRMPEVIAGPDSPRRRRAPSEEYRHSLEQSRSRWESSVRACPTSLPARSTSSFST